METPSPLVLRLISLLPVAAGLAATLLAAIAFAGWIAIGTFFLPSSVRSEIRLAGSVLIGSGITAFVYALLTRGGLVDAAIVTIAIVSIAAILLRRSDMRRVVAAGTNEYKEAIKSSRMLRFLFIPILLLMWIYAIAPPRDGDVMRYHLAHIRQIITDGGWQPIADYHYAFPFGWSLNYLPFERLHLPQAAALVNVALWLVIVSGLLSIAGKGRGRQAAQLAVAALFVHPNVMRTFGSAMVDGYAVIVVYAIVVSLLFLDELNGLAVTLLGFVCWIGLQSRYQHIAWGIAGTLVFLFFAARKRLPGHLKNFSIGSAAALFLSAPFYLANLRLFGNPLWPLMIRLDGSSSYADQVAASYTHDMTGEYHVRYVLMHIWELVSTPSVFPIAIACSLLVIVGLFLRDRFTRVALCGAIFLAIWLIAEPRLYPKHILLVLPIAALIAIAIIDRSAKWVRVFRFVKVAAATALAGMFAVSVGLSGDYARYAVTGDGASYHQFTWYYSTYDWVNRNTPPRARVLVIVLSGHSYYLDRPYRRADPWLSGVVDWSRLKSGADLSNVLARGRYQYVIYDERQWKGYVGGEEMERALREMIASGSLVPVHQQSETLYTSRAMREFEATNVSVLRVAARPGGA
ncbi:MAG TPA: hypothetical protein VM099_01815 [Gemmatimonadaceae bacterium]|nr:hypothetical protein [Gemmatimonadaceae bacterium]